MTVVADIAMSLTIAPRSVQAEPGLATQSPLDFGTLLAGRALLDAPTSAVRGGPAPDGEGKLPVVAAPAALRFDEAPLFGRALLGGREDAPGAVRAAVADLPAARSALSEFSPDRPIGAAAAGPDDDVASPIPAANARVLAYDRADLPATERSGLAATADDLSAAAAGSAPGQTTSGSRASPEQLREVRNAVAFRHGLHSGRPALRSADIHSDPAASVRADRMSDARARFVDRLGPVHLLVRQEGAALVVAARVAAITAEAEADLDRRLRGAAADWHLLNLTVNGRAPAPSGRAG